MRDQDYRNSKQELPTENGTYDWKIIRGCSAVIDYRDGRWYSKNGDKMPDDMKIWWR